MADPPTGVKSIRSLIGRMAAERPAFVIVNVAVNMLLLARSYVTMQVLDYRELGLAALLQSILLIAGVLQFGFLNGGYRLMCSAEGEEARRINNLVYTALGILTLLWLTASAVSLGFIREADVALVSILGFVGAATTLGRTWMSNQMIARGALRQLNRINLISGLASIATLAFIPIDPLWACLAAVVALPFTFVVASALIDPRLLPTGIESSGRLIRMVFHAGFIVFLTGLLLQFNLQIERWYVTITLGLDALGRLYLALLFVTIFQLVPTSLGQIFLPPMVRAHAAGETLLLRRQHRQYLWIVIGYCIVAIAALVFLADPILRLILPSYINDLRYVYFLAPGLILFTLSDPFGVIFNVLILYRYFLIAYGAGSIATVAIFGYSALQGGMLGLDGVMLVRSGAFALMSGIVMVGYFRIAARNRELRLFGPIPAPASS